MMRLLVLGLVVILGVSEARRCFSGRVTCGRHRNRHQKITFEEVANEVIAADRKIQDFCDTHTNLGVKEMYGSDDYTIKVPLQNVSEDTVEVLIKHRVLHLTAIEEEIQKRNPKKKKIEYMKILPDNVKTNSPAYWYLENGELGMVFPYKVKLNEESLVKCDNNISDKAFPLPKSRQTSTVSPNDDDENEVGKY